MLLLSGPRVDPVHGPGDGVLELRQRLLPCAGQDPLEHLGAVPPLQWHRRLRKRTGLRGVQLTRLVPVQGFGQVVDQFRGLYAAGAGEPVRPAQRQPDLLADELLLIRQIHQRSQCPLDPRRRTRHQPVQGLEQIEAGGIVQADRIECQQLLERALHDPNTTNRVRQFPRQESAAR